MNAIIIGLDIAKSVFQVHGEDAEGKVVIQKRPFVRRNRTDARDAAAICVAARRPDMRAVAIKSEAQQASRALERSCELLIKRRMQLMNSLRAMLVEFGVVAAQGYRGFAELTARLRTDDPGLPETLVAALRVVLAQLDGLTPAIEDRIKAGSSRPIRTCGGSPAFPASALSPPMRWRRRSARGGSSPAGATSPPFRLTRSVHTFTVRQCPPHLA